jgi:predicted RNase H-like HicB family nuclease
LTLRVELEKESVDRWIADVVTLPGVMVYGPTKAEALQAVKALALEVLADRIKNGEDLLTGHRPMTRRAPQPFRGVEFVTA